MGAWRLRMDGNTLEGEIRMKHIVTSIFGVVGGAIAAAFGGWSESTAR